MDIKINPVNMLEDIYVRAYITEMTDIDSATKDKYLTLMNILKAHGITGAEAITLINELMEAFK